VNPYRQMDVYGADTVDAYRGRELYENPPHLYAVSDAAYKAMKRRAKDTCIVISGPVHTGQNAQRDVPLSLLPWLPTDVWRAGGKLFKLFNLMYFLD